MAINNKVNKEKKLPDHKAVPEAFPVRADQELPDINILGHTFLTDWLARELRPLDKESKPVSLTQMNLVHDEGTWRLRFLYDPTHRQIAPEPQIGLEYPRDILIMEIPGNPKMLDPEGLAIELGLDPAAYIKRHPVQLFLIAKVIPWESTRYSKTVEQNKIAAAQRARPAKMPIKKRSKGKGI